MFSPHTSSGFNYAPVSKVLLGSMFATSIAVSFPFSVHRHLFLLAPNELTAGREIWKLITSQLVFLDAKDLICAAMLIYNFRIFERRLGSRKFVGYMLATCALSTGLEVAVLLGSKQFGVDLQAFPSGPFGVLFSLFVPFFCDVPRVAMTHVMGIPVTGKSLSYLVGLQMCSDSLEGVILASCGIVAGILYRTNFLFVQSVFFVPKRLGNFFHNTIGKLLESHPPNNTQLPMGATLEIQRQQQMERLEQQMLWAQLRQQNGFGRHDAANNLIPGLFGNQNEEPPAAGPQPGPSGGQRVEADETQVQLLTDMGFQRENVVNALRVTNNNPSLATNILLQQS